MMYFILWVVFLLLVILSVPVVSFLEKRKAKEARSPVDEAAGEEESQEGVEDQAAAGEFDEQAEMAEVPEIGEGGDDFAEFEELR